MHAGGLLIKPLMRDLLIALCGLTPQVVTETLWALGQQRPPIVPQELWIITTQSGQQACQRALLGPQGKLAAYFRDYPPSQPIRYGLKTIITLKGADGRPLDDLRTQEENQAVADQLASVIRKLTAQPHQRLHCSVAGGRKTMGVLLAAVLQIYGRPDDRLYHVLVSPAFESHQDFYYIPKQPGRLVTREGQRLDTRQARIELAEIPYVRLRAFLSEALLRDPLPFTELVHRAQTELRAFEDPAPVRIDLARREVRIGDAAIRMTPSQRRLYTAFARIKVDQCVEQARPTCHGCTACYLEISQGTWPGVHVRLQELAGETLLSPQNQRGESQEIAVERFRSLWSKTNKALDDALGSERLAARYHIASIREAGATRYGLAVDKTRICLVR